MRAVQILGSLTGVTCRDKFINGCKQCLRQIDKHILNGLVPLQILILYQIVHPLFDVLDFRNEPFLHGDDNLGLDLFEGQLFLRLHYPDDSSVEFLFPVCLNPSFSASALLRLVISPCQLVSYLEGSLK